jgi:hypothetical protein
MTAPAARRKSFMLSLITFRAFGNSFRIITDAPDIARLAPVFRFGAEAEIETVRNPVWPRAGALALVKDRGLFDSLSSGMSGARAVSCGPHAGLLYSETGECAAALLPENKADAETAVLCATPVFVRIVMLKSNWCFMHAAAAAANGQAVAFVGDNECGKSTLARTLVSRGWDLLADDSLPVVMQGQDVCAMPVREAVNARALDAKEREALMARGYKECGLAGFLTPPELNADEPASLRMIFYPEWGAAGDAVARDASPAFAYKKLLAACISPLQGDDMRLYVKILDQLMARSRHIRITLVRESAAPAVFLQDILRGAGLC